MNEHQKPQWLVINNGEQLSNPLPLQIAQNLANYYEARGLLFVYVSKVGG
jgi:hypothetical protein